MPVYVCNQCDKRFPGPMSLAEHVRFSHTSELLELAHPTYSCPYCDKQGLGSETMVSHLVKNHQDKVADAFENIEVDKT